MAERMVPGYQEAKEIVAAPLTPANAMAKLNAAEQLREWTAWLFPGDADG